MSAELASLYEEMKKCTACKLRAACTQVVTCDGCLESPFLMVVGEAPGADEDAQGFPFVGMAGMVLRDVLRGTKIINRTNTLITNTVHCRPPNNKFPKDESADVCTSKWLFREIEIAAPKRLLLLGNVALKYLAGQEGVTRMRGKWILVHGIRSMPTFHPSYVMRKDNEGDMQARELFRSDIMEVALEVKALQEKEATVMAGTRPE